VPGAQVVPAQQPDGQEVASQMQLPPTQRCPAAQAAPLPQAQLPPLQLSASLPQTTHCAPPVPQAAVDGEAHRAPLQQPDAHEVASQMHWPDEQRCPALQTALLPQRQTPLVQLSASVELQAAQVAPAAPQLESDSAE
jgi:hypothetical protein